MHRFDGHRLTVVHGCTDHSQPKFFLCSEFSQCAAQCVEMLDRAVTAGPTNHERASRCSRWWHLITLRIDGGRNHGDTIVHLSRIVGRVWYTGHDVRHQLPDSLGRRGKLQIAQITVCRTAIRDEDGVVEVENDWHARLMDHSLEHWWSKQRGLAQDINQVEFFRFFYG